MGLDCTAYSNIKLLHEINKNNEDTDDFWERGLARLYMTGFARHSDNLKDGWYEAEDSYGWCAGSYSGYNRWRNTVSEVGLGVPAKVVWENFDQYEDEGLAWLVHFSDCEGFIGPETSKKILVGLQKIQEDNLFTDEYDLVKLNHWIIGMTLAANNGAVVFH